MAEPLEYLPPLVTGLVALVPLIALLRARRRVKSTRLLLAALAFGAFSLSGLALFVVESEGRSWSGAAEWIEFGSDLVIVGLFALSFMWPREEPDDA